MADKPTQAVRWEVGQQDGKCFVRFTTAGANPLTIPMEPQAASEMGEMMARAAHMAVFGKPLKGDIGYLKDQVKSRVTDRLRQMMVTRLTVMLNSLREDKTRSNRKLATELVDVVLNKVA